MTVLCKLIAKEEDFQKYITYVFENLEEDVIKETRYVMCIRYPNWEHRDIELGEIGYLNFIEIRAGIDQWFDGNKMVYYNYNNIQFIKFIAKHQKEDYKYEM